MRRYAGLAMVALVAGLTTSSFGQMGGMGGAGGGGVGGRFPTLQNFGNAGVETNKSKVCSVKITSGDGKTSQGTLRLSSAVVGCSFGIYEIKPDKVQEIRFTSPPRMDQVVMGQTGVQRVGAIVTASGEVIDGIVLIPSWWRIETDLGVLTPNSEGLKSIVFVRNPDEAPNEAPKQGGPIPSPGGILPAPGSTSPPADLPGEIVLPRRNPSPPPAP